MKRPKIALLLMAALMALASCSSGTSYAELLSDESIAVNAFLANNRVIPYEARDTTFQFEVGSDAPYYELDSEGNVYMQVLNAGTRGNYAVDDQLIYFRFTRYNLELATNGILVDSSGDPLEGEGNDADLSYGSTSFRFQNTSSYSSYQWGTGLQMPLIYLPIDCEVNIVIKSQYGLYSEIANVIPYLYNVRYFKSQI
ncbi:MAG: DUF4827 domain-containing protein [Bacteroidales bacterium]|nr:DUF4827 domain-containing protein [Bacteroidales bacterium]